jgi:3-methyladenine DNA glycosylase AlkD
MGKLLKLKKELQSIADKEQSKNLQSFFKTGKGEYGEGDIFLGIKVPVQRKIAKKYIDLSLKDLQNLLDSKIHEYRFTALIIIIQKNRGLDISSKEIFDFYIKNFKNVNNWDLVDISAPHIVGRYLFDKSNRKILYKFAKSKNLWEKRISIVSTFAFIRENQFEDTLKIAEILLNDEHDLIHKAVGWALREVGKKDRKTEEIFLKKYYKQMPRTMLRYAIEKFPEDLRIFYLKGKSDSQKLKDKNMN